MKKLFAIVLTLALAFGMVPTVPTYATQEFNDVPADHWAFDYISEMVERGVLSGYPNGSFQPGKTITRAEFATAMCLVAGLDPATVDSTSYSDVDAADWFAPYVECGKDYLTGYVADDGQSYYMPNAETLREDIAVALVKFKGYDTAAYDESVLETTFTDYQAISTDARAYVTAAVEQGLISGYDDRTFRGQSTITRAEAATLLWKAYPDSDDTDTSPETTPGPEKEYTYESTTIAMVNADVTSMVATDEGVYYICQPKTVDNQGNDLYQGETKIYFTAKDGKGTQVALDATTLDWIGDIPKIYGGFYYIVSDTGSGFSSKLYCLGIDYTTNDIYTALVQAYDGTNLEDPDHIYHPTYGSIMGGDYQNEYIYNVTEKRIVHTFERDPDTGSYESFLGGFRSGYLLSFDAFGNHKISKKNKSTAVHSSNAYMNGNWIQFNDSNILGVDGYTAPDEGKIFAFNATKFYLSTQNDEFYSVDADGNMELLFSIDDINRADGKLFSYNRATNMLMGFELGTAAVSNDETFYFYDANYRCIRQIKRIDK